MKIFNPRNIFISIIVLVILSIIIFLLVFSSSRRSDIDVLQPVGVESIISANDGVTFLSGGFINKINLTKNNNKLNQTLIDKDVLTAIPSLDTNKVYYTKNKGGKIISAIYQADKNKVTEYKQYDEFFWNKNQGLFAEYSDAKSTIYNEDLIAKYNKIPYANFIAYANIVLGSPFNNNPEFDGYNLINISPQKNQVNKISLDNYTEEYAPWEIDDFFLYNDSETNLHIVNAQGADRNTNNKILQKYLSKSPGNTQYFVSFNKTVMTISTIDLSNGAVVKIKSLNMASVLKGNSLSIDNLTQTVYSNGFIYLLMDGKIVRVKL